MKYANKKISLYKSILLLSLPFLSFNVNSTVIFMLKYVKQGEQIAWLPSSELPDIERQALSPLIENDTYLAYAAESKLRGKGLVFNEETVTLGTLYNELFERNSGDFIEYLRRYVNDQINVHDILWRLSDINLKFEGLIDEDISAIENKKSLPESSLLFRHFKLGIQEKLVFEWAKSSDHNSNLYTIAKIMYYTGTNDRPVLILRSLILAMVFQQRSEPKPPEARENHLLYDFFRSPKSLEDFNVMTITPRNINHPSVPLPAVPPVTEMPRDHLCFYHAIGHAMGEKAENIISDITLTARLLLENHSDLTELLRQRLQGIGGTLEEIAALAYVDLKKPGIQLWGHTGLLPLIAWLYDLTIIVTTPNTWRDGGVALHFTPDGNYDILTANDNNIATQIQDIHESTPNLLILQNHQNHWNVHDIYDVFYYSVTQDLSCSIQ